MHAAPCPVLPLPTTSRTVRTSPATIWLTGRRGSGRRTLARAVVAGLAVTGRHAVVLDDVRVTAASCAGRHVTAGGPVECAAELAMTVATGGVIAIVVAASPRVWDRERARRAHEQRGLPFVEVFLDTPPDICAGRAGADPAYEAPPLPDLVVRPGPLLPTVLSIVDLV